MGRAYRSCAPPCCSSWILAPAGRKKRRSRVVIPLPGPQMLKVSTEFLRWLEFEAEDIFFINLTLLNIGDKSGDTDRCCLCSQSLTFLLLCVTELQILSRLLKTLPHYTSCKYSVAQICSWKQSVGFTPIWVTICLRELYIRYSILRHLIWVRKNPFIRENGWNLWKSYRGGSLSQHVQ